MGTTRFEQFAHFFLTHCTKREAQSCILVAQQTPLHSSPVQCAMSSGCSGWVDYYAQCSRLPCLGQINGVCIRPSVSYFQTPTLFFSFLLLILLAPYMLYTSLHPAIQPNPIQPTCRALRCNVRLCYLSAGTQSALACPKAKGLSDWSQTSCLRINSTKISVPSQLPIRVIHAYARFSGPREPKSNPHLWTLTQEE